MRRQPGAFVRRALRWTAWLAAGAVALLAAAALSLPYLIDSAAVQRELEHRVSSALHGKVSWESLELRLLPVPRGDLHRARLSIPGALEASVARAEIELKLRPLFRGQVEIAAIRISQPTLSVQFGATPEQADAPIDPRAAYRTALRRILQVVDEFMPEATLSLEQGRLQLTGPAAPARGALVLDARATTDAEGIALDAAVAGKRWKTLRIGARVERSDLRARAKLEAVGLRVEELAATLPGLQLTETDVNIEARIDAAGVLTAQYHGALPRLAYRRGDQRIEASDTQVTGTARLAQGDAQANGSVTLASLRLGRSGRALDIPDVRMNVAAKLQGDAATLALTDVRLGALISSARATLHLSGEKRAPQASFAVDALDLVRMREAALALASDVPAVRDYAPRISAGRLTRVHVAAASESMATLFRLQSIRGTASLAGGALSVPVLEVNASEIGAQLEFSKGSLRASKAGLRLGASRLTDGTLELALRSPMVFTASGGQATLMVEEWLAWLRAREGTAKLLQALEGVAASGQADATLRRLRMRIDDPGSAEYDFTLSPRRLQVKAPDLPVVQLDGGTLRIASDALVLDRLGASALDAAVRVSGTVTEYKSRKPRVEARADDVEAGSEAIAWIWEKASLPAKLRPAAPLRATATRIQWTAGALDLAARTWFPAGTQVSADLGVRGENFGVHEIALKDRESDAVLSLSRRGNAYEARFAGLLTDRSLVSLFADPPPASSGRVRGDLLLRFERGNPKGMSAKGKLDAQDIHLGALLPVPLVVRRADLDVDGQDLQVRELTVELARQQATLRGEIARRSTGLVMRAAIESPGVDLDALLPAQAKQGEALPRELWPLPVTGTVSVRSGHVVHRGLRVEPLHATLALEPRRADLTVTDAALCGIAFPFSAQATPERIETRVRLSAKDAELERVAQCLSEERLLITGRFDLSADLRSSGKLEALARSIQGPVELRARKGEIRKFALIGNILSVTDVKGVLDKEVRLDRDGFDYRSINVSGRFGEGRFDVAQAFLDSDAVGLAATGHVGLDYASKLSVLVAPFSRVDRAVRGVPIVGYVIGGAFTSVPVGVSGDIRDPLVVPLGPGAVSSELLGIFERTLKLPQKLVAPLESTPAK